MNKITFCLMLFFLAGFKLSAHADSLDSLKQKLQLTTDSLKGPVYIAIAAHYLHYDTIANRNERYYYQGEALNYTMLALHTFSRINDTLGLRSCFNNLSKIYRSQKRYSQAKWFILQSNTISRQKNDVPNVIASLIELSVIKSEIKEYSLAMRDLNEAIHIAIANKDLKTESAVQVAYAGLYRQMNDNTKASLAIQRHEIIEESIVHKAEEDRLALLIKPDSILIKKQNPIVMKKKTYSYNSKRGTKLGLARHLTSL